MLNDSRSLKNELVEQAGSMEAIDAKIAGREMMAGPPSADQEHVLPGRPDCSKRTFVFNLMRKRR
ncbi:MAG: hypothetical protein JRF65_16130 [Deltaproteobacteria bacterium]|nr:hypothetical protein [Deltaproteobacteria bacterium]